jgi:hypothetical protein
MATFDQFPALVCKNCSRPIPLPPAKRPDTLEGQGLWPQGGSRRNFLCPACRHVHGYSAPDVQLMLPHTDPRKAGTSYNVVYIRLRCGVQSCASIVRIRTLMAFDKETPKEAPVILASSCAHALQCGNGHILSGHTYPYGLAFDAHFDEDWEIREGGNGRTPARLCAEDRPHKFQISPDPHPGLSISRCIWNVRKENEQDSTSVPSLLAG